MNVEALPVPEEDWMFYIHPLGHELYIREEVDGERRERPVFSHNAAPTWHLSGVHSDQQEFETVAPSDGFWKAVRLIYVASQQDDDERYRELIQQARKISGTLEYHETDTIDKLFGTLHQLECSAREIDVFDRLFAEVEDRDLVQEALNRLQSGFEKWQSQNDDSEDEEGDQQ